MKNKTLRRSQKERSQLMQKNPGHENISSRRSCHTVRKHCKKFSSENQTSLSNGLRNMWKTLTYNYSGYLLHYIQLNWLNLTIHKRARVKNGFMTSLHIDNFTLWERTASHTESLKFNDPLKIFFIEQYLTIKYDIFYLYALSFFIYYILITGYY